MDPQLLKSLSDDIVRSHGEPGNSDIQTSVLMRCMQVLSSPELATEIHLFCNASLHPIAGHSLIMFSFPGQQNPHSVLAKERMVRSLELCPDCIRGFERCLSQMKLRFTLVRKIPIAQVDAFIEIITKWQVERLRNTLADENAPDLKVHNAVIECILNPLILGNVDLKTLVRWRLTSQFELPKYLTPGLVRLLVEGDQNDQKTVDKLISGLASEPLQIDPQVVDEVNRQAYRLQDAKFFSPDLSYKFWGMVLVLLDRCPAHEFTKILKPADLDEMSSYKNLRFLPLVVVLLKNVMAHLDKPLPRLLIALQKLMKMYPHTFWELALGIAPANMLNTVVANTNFHRHLHEAVIDPNLSFSLADLLDWTLVFISTLSSSQRQATALRLTEFCVQMEASELQIQVFYSVKLLLSCFSVDNLLPTQSAVSLLKMRDARLCISKHANHFLKLAKSSADAMHLIAVLLQYDVLVAANNLAALARMEQPTFSDTHTALWTELRNILLTPLMVSAIAECFEYALYIVIFKDKKKNELTKEFDAAFAIHNRESQTLCTNISAVLDKISFADSEQLLTLITKEPVLVSLWSCIFCAQTSQLALNILSQIYDSEGRYEAILELLKNLGPNLKAINASLKVTTTMKIFEPCPRVMRILMDVIKALADPLSGILAVNSELGGKCQDEIDLFWKSCWSFLIMVYQTTLTWASMYHLQDLVEFTRDTLDTSHLLLDSYRTISDVMSEDRKASMFNVFMTAFNDVIVWLRLGDPSLLTSCLNLVFKGFDLAKDLGVDVDKSFILTFAKYGARARKFNNKLTEQQRLEVLAKASEFDLALVQFVIEDVARDRKSTALPAPAPSPAATPGATYAYQSRKQVPKQLTLSRFGVVTKEAPVAPAPPKPFKSNNLEAIRSELKNNRGGSSAPINPAPARPAGFNHHKQPVVGRSLNQLKSRKVDTDSLEDDEEDVDTSDLFYDAKKKTKITELDIHGRPVVKMAAAKKVDTKRLEEERMRMRLNVNLKPLYSAVLKWNYTSNSEYPSDDRLIYFAKKDKYASSKEYANLVEPLLMLECWQGIQSSRATGQEVPFELLIGSRTTCDTFFDVYTSVKKTDLKDRGVGDSDLLVLGYVQDKGLTHPREISRYLKNKDTQTCLAKVREIKSANADYSDVTIRVWPQGSMMGLLTPKSIIVGMRVMQMTTVEREYSSLKGLQYYDLCDSIVKAEPAVPVEISDERASEICKSFNVNISQAKAILGSHMSEGFSLIQGPPGTGKTKTILGIVGHFLSSLKQTNIIEVPGAPKPSGEEAAGPKVLICAPSNAAIDELVVRLKNGVVDAFGKSFTPKIVRLGRSDIMSPSVRELSLEELVDKALSVRAKEAPIDPNIRQQHNDCLAERDKIRKELKDGDLTDQQVQALETKLREVLKKRNELGKKLDEQRERAHIAHRTREIERRQAQAKVLTEAQIICATLSGSAHDCLLSLSMKFDLVIIDEACQCVELSAIVPLRYGCKRCIMVGDPNQLPPTVLSQAAASYKYEESLFVRMQKNNPNSVYLLDVQYRMHPSISKFPSSQFYQGRLSDGEGMLEKNDRPWHQKFPLTPYRFFDIASRHEQSNQTKSFFNTEEAQVALELVEELMNILPNNKFKGRIGVISPYKEQIKTLRDVFQRQWGSTIFHEIDFNTVDGFQGQEKEIIIMSCVRASSTGSVGFLSDIRRMNVALTRARTTLWVLGNKDSLKRDKIWLKLINDAESRLCVTKAYPGFLKRIVPPKVKSPQIQEIIDVSESPSPEEKTQHTAQKVTGKSEKSAEKSKNLADKSEKSEKMAEKSVKSIDKPEEVVGKPEKPTDGAGKSVSSEKHKNSSPEKSSNEKGAGKHDKPVVSGSNANTTSPCRTEKPTGQDGDHQKKDKKSKHVDPHGVKRKALRSDLFDSSDKESAPNKKIAKEITTHSLPPSHSEKKHKKKPYVYQPNSTTAQRSGQETPQISSAQDSSQNKPNGSTVEGPTPQSSVPRPTSSGQYRNDSYKSSGYNGKAVHFDNRLGYNLNSLRPGSQRAPYTGPSGSNSIPVNPDGRMSRNSSSSPPMNSSPVMGAKAPPKGPSKSGVYKPPPKNSIFIRRPRPQNR